MNAFDRHSLAFGGPPERLVAYAGRLGRTLAVARALALSRRAIDLGGIQDGVGMLCAQTLDLSLPEGRQMLPVLRELLAQVDSLSAVLREHTCPIARQG